MLLSVSLMLTFMAELCCVEYVCPGLRHADSYIINPSQHIVNFTRFTCIKIMCFE